LFNLVEDIGEKNDLAAKNPEKAKELQALYDAWNAQLAKPLWKHKPAARDAAGWQPAAESDD
jgi:hypothetical protein